MRSLIILLSTLLVFASCNNSNRKRTHDKGFKYINHIKSEYGLSPRPTDIVILNLKITAPNDSILEEATNITMQVQQPAHKGGSIEDALMFMHRGDSISFFINAIDFYTYSKQTPAPQHFKEKDLLRFDIGLVDVMSVKKFEEIRRTKLSSGFLEEREFLEDFLEKVSKNRVELDSMLYYLPERNGIGPKIEKGDLITMNYIAYFIDGKIFANTYANNSPFTIIVGDEALIPGLEIALIGLQEYSKGRVVIPSYLAYGSTGVKDMIPPFSSLVFDIEIISVTKNK